MTRVASSLTLKHRSIVRIRENPSKATAEERSSFSVNSTALQIMKVEIHAKSQNRKRKRLNYNYSTSNPLYYKIMSEQINSKMAVLIPKKSESISLSFTC